MNYKNNSSRDMKVRVNELIKKIDENKKQKQFIYFAGTVEGKEIICCCEEENLSCIPEEPQNLLRVLRFIKQNLPEFRQSVNFLMLFGSRILSEYNTDIQLLVFDIIDTYMCDYNELFNIILEKYQEFVVFEGDSPPGTFVVVTQILVKYMKYIPCDQLKNIIEELTSCLSYLNYEICVEFLKFVFSDQERGENFPVDKCSDKLIELSEHFLGVFQQKEITSRRDFFRLLITLHDFKYEEVVCDIISRYLTSCMEEEDNYSIEFKLLTVEAASTYPDEVINDDFYSLILWLCGKLMFDTEEKLVFVFAALVRCLNNMKKKMFPIEFLCEMFNVIGEISGENSELSAKTKCGVVCFINALLNTTMLRGSEIWGIMEQFNVLIEKIINDWFGLKEINDLIFQIMYVIYKIRNDILNDEKSFKWVMSTYMNFLASNNGCLSSEEEEFLEELFEHEIDFKNGVRREDE